MLLDLVNAFDYALKEFIFGYRFDQSCEDRVQKMQIFEALNLPKDAAGHIVDWLDEHWSILEGLGVDKKAFELCKSLYSWSWCQMDGSDDLIVSRCGGRQGCRLGAMIFNVIYAVALQKARAQLAALGVTMVIHFDVARLFAGIDAENTFTFDEREFFDTDALKSDIDVTFVDDEAFMFLAKSPAALSSAIPWILTCIVRTFYTFGFRLNFNAGKSEALPKFTGKNSSYYKCELHKNMDPNSLCHQKLDPIHMVPRACESSIVTNILALLYPWMVCAIAMYHIVYPLLWAPLFRSV